MVKITILGLIAVFLTFGLLAMSCGDPVCDNIGNCRINYITSMPTIIGCSNTDTCVIFDTQAALNAFDNGISLICDCPLPSYGAWHQ